MISKLLVQRKYVAGTAEWSNIFISYKKKGSCLRNWKNESKIDQAKETVACREKTLGSSIWL